MPVDPIPSGTPAWMNDLPVTAISVELEGDEPWESDRPGVALRGALLASLLAVQCVRDKECGPCDLRASCAFPSFWRPLGNELTRWWTRPWLEPGQTTVRFGLGFVGTLPEPHAFASALQRTCRAGLGPDRIPHRMQAVHVFGEGGETLWIDGERTVGTFPGPARLAELVRPRPLSEEVTVRLDTPYLGRKAPRPADWIQAAIGRVRGLARSVDRRLDVRWPTPPAGLGEARLQRRVASRRPRSQPGRQDLSGFVGTLHFSAEEIEERSKQMSTY